MTALATDPDITAPSEWNSLQARWDDIYKSHGDWLGGCLRTLYGLIRWIDEHPVLNDDEKRRYVSIIRAQLSDAELRVLFINGMTATGAKFVKYVNRYALLDNMRPEEIPLVEVLRRWSDSPYTACAYSTDEADKVEWTTPVKQQP
ncbi:putative phage abortive infection protein [Bordetella bronchialis]|uniref:Uncharacterized protein n=1 Tax=Bordetella bronchialis TaxID=463025 RepID=A0ABM6CMT9_9BORD|nr:putative phage abortive infection protein [Bordetella bronchialis]ANN65254.1 hypothetical protein BAU06_02085 [Bordetella bronchialis]